MAILTPTDQWQAREAIIQAAIAYEEAWSSSPDGSSIAFRWERVSTARSALLEAVRALKETHG